MFYQCPNLPPKENCPFLVEVIQNPRGNFPSYLVCMELPEFPKSLPTIVRAQDQSAVQGTTTTTTTSTSGIAGTSTTTSTSSSSGTQVGGATTTTTTL